MTSMTTRRQLPLNIDRDCPVSALPAHRLASWYEVHQRPLPWRETQDPYRILVSETMLQQTRVETVIPYYHAFLAAFPTFHQLAAAEEDQVLKRWQGLGYYSRARNLHRAAQVVAQTHDGVIPQDEAALRELPGVGDYTTGAVMSIAFNAPVPAVDGNVLRVMTRYLGIAHPIDKPAVKREVREAVHDWLLASEPRYLTQAIMELGALVCVPKTPHCTDCPIQVGCIANRDNLTAVLPMRKSKKPRKQSDVVALWLEVDGNLLVERRPEQGLLAGMWQLPAVELNRGEHVSPEVVLNTLKQRADSLDAVPTACREHHTASDADTGGAGQPGEHAFALVTQERHIFTHLEWHVHVYRPVGPYEPCRSLQQFGIIGFEGRVQWVPRAKLDTLTWPRVYEKIIASMLGQPRWLNDPLES